MPTVMMLVPDNNGVPDLQLEEGETLLYSIGNVDVWRDSVGVEAQPPDPENKWTRQNELDGGWVKVDEIIDEEIVIGYTVIRRNETTVESFRGNANIISPAPANAPNDGIAVEVTTTEPMITTIDERLSAINGVYGIWGEIKPDA